jgi:hypothetical protein
VLLDQGVGRAGVELDAGREREGAERAVLRQLGAGRLGYRRDLAALGDAAGVAGVTQLGGTRRISSLVIFTATGSSSGSLVEYRSTQPPARGRRPATHVRQRQRRRHPSGVRLRPVPIASGRLSTLSGAPVRTMHPSG